MRFGLLLCVGLVFGCSQVTDLRDKLVAQPETQPQSTIDSGEAPLAAPLSVEPLPVEGSEPVTKPEPVKTAGLEARTVAALGDPARPGAWMETPLVTSERPGQVHYGDQGVNVTLIPAGGPPTGGSSLSLEAMQALGLPLTELTEVKVLF